MNLIQFRQHLVLKQQGIVPESDEDCAAYEYHGELQHIIDTIDNGGDVKSICDVLGEKYLVDSLAERKQWYLTKYHTVGDSEWYGVREPGSHKTVAGPLRLPDAQLIAAAPDMLDVLKKVDQLLADDHSQTARLDMSIIIRKVIEKAEGK